MKTLKLSIQLLKKNIRSVAGFEITYHLICMAILLPVLSALFQFSLKLAGYDYLSEDRLIPYLLTPSSLLILFLIVLALSMITVYEIFCIIPAFHASYHGKTISLTAMYRYGFFVLQKSCRLKNLPLLLFAVFLIPLTNISVISGYLSSRTIPDFILYYIRSNKTLFHIICLLFLLFLLFAIRYCLAMHTFCLERGSFKESLKKAFRLSEHHYLSVLFTIIIWQLLILFVLALVVLLSFFTAFVVMQLFFADDITGVNLYDTFTIILTVLFDSYILFGIPLFLSVLGSIYYRQKIRLDQPVPAFVEKGSSLLKRITRRVFLFFILLACLFNLTYLGLAQEYDFFWNQSLWNDPTITAHRGDSRIMPENTLAAFLSAIENHADVIELDVQQTKDHVIVVLHDTNLKRLTGINQNVWDLTYEELKQIDIAPYFQEEKIPDAASTETVWAEYGIDERAAYHTVPTLEQTLSFCRDKIDLNIELKTTSYNNNFEKGVASALEAYDYLGHCVVVAKNPDSLRLLKACNPDIQTIYLLPLAYGNYCDMTYVDGFSIKHSFLTRKLVNDIHDQGKVIYAWTVNSEEDLSRMYALGVDSVVTDYPVRAREVYYAQSLNPELTAWLRQLAHMWQ